MARTDSENGIKSLDRLFEIIGEMEERGAVGVRELADETGMSKSTVHRHLSTLEEHNFAVKEDGQYCLSFRFLEIGGRLRSQWHVFNNEIKPKIAFLAENTDELVGFMTEEHGLGVLVYRMDGDNAVATEGHLGKRFHLHHSAGGKAILSQLPESRIREIIAEHGLPRKTEQTITSKDVLFDELRDIREKQIAFDRGETTEGLWAIGAPLKDNTGSLIGAFNVIGPKHRIIDEDRQEQIVKLLLGSINEIELNITHEPMFDRGTQL